MASTVFILGISSDIGAALATRFHQAGCRVIGTFRRGPEPMPGPDTIRCDIEIDEDIAALPHFMRDRHLQWDVFISAVGDLAPIGPFFASDAAAWERSCRVNGPRQLRVLHALYPFRAPTAQCHAVFLAGGGVNGPFRNYSAYCLGKIALIKMCELLADEEPGLNVFISGTGWVRTKIHQATLAAGANAGANLERTQAFLESSSDGTSHDEIFAHIQWAMAAGREVTSGRNFAIVHDDWRNTDGKLESELRGDPDRFRLRRSETPRRQTAEAIRTAPQPVIPWSPNL